LISSEALTPVSSVLKIGILRDKKKKNGGGEGQEGGYSNFFEELR